MGQEPIRDGPRPAAFYSRKLTLRQTNYPIHQQETLAIVEAVKAFAPYLLHSLFTEAIEHESLTKLMAQKNLNRRQQRWPTHISHFDFKIE